MNQKEFAKRVAFKKLAKGKWVLQYPTPNNGPLNRQTFTGPKIEKTRNRKRPLKAVFQNRFELYPFNATKKDKPEIANLKREFVYGRLTQLWILTN